MLKLRVTVGEGVDRNLIPTRLKELVNYITLQHVTIGYIIAVKTPTNLMPVYNTVSISQIMHAIYKCICKLPTTLVA